MHFLPLLNHHFDYHIISDKNIVVQSYLQTVERLEFLILPVA
jgi:hypothetical protein